MEEDFEVRAKDHSRHSGPKGGFTGKFFLLTYDWVCLILHRFMPKRFHRTFKTSEESVGLAPISIKNHWECIEQQYYFMVRIANRRRQGEVALLGVSGIPIKPGYSLFDEDNQVTYLVKGIETVHDQERSKSHMNPWIIIDTENKPEDFSDKTFVIFESNDHP